MDGPALSRTDQSASEGRRPATGTPTRPPIVVVHVPHAATDVPEDVRGELLLTDAQLHAELLRMTDAWTDDLFGVGATVGTVVRFPVSRLIVDPERFTDDSAEIMARVGMGVVYERTSDGSVLRRRTDPRRRQALLERYYVPHHAALTSAVEGALATWGTCLVVDGHSFPPRALPFEVDASAPREDFCLGTDAFHTPAELLRTAQTWLEDHGFGVSVNRPFAGALVPSSHFGKDRRVHALMVEVNRRLYMDGESGVRLAGFGHVRSTVHALVGHLATYMHATMSSS